MPWLDRGTLLDVEDPVERWLRVVAGVGAIVMIIGSLLPWISKDLFAAGLHEGGFGMFEGKAVLVLGFLTLVASVFRIPLEVVFVLAGTAGVVELAWLIGNFADFVGEPPITDFRISPASGFGVAMLGTSLATLSGFARVVSRRREPASQAPARAAPPPPPRIKRK